MISLAPPKLTDAEINNRLKRTDHAVYCTLEGLNELPECVPCFELYVLGELPKDRMN